MLDDHYHKCYHKCNVLRVWFHYKLPWTWRAAGQLSSVLQQTPVTDLKRSWQTIIVSHSHACWSCWIVQWHTSERRNRKWFLVLGDDGKRRQWLSGTDDWRHGDGESTETFCMDRIWFRVKDRHRLRLLQQQRAGQRSRNPIFFSQSGLKGSTCDMEDWWKGLQTSGRKQTQQWGLLLPTKATNKRQRVSFMPNMCLSMLRGAWEDDLHNPVVLVSAELRGGRVGVNTAPFWPLP